MAMRPYRGDNDPGYGDLADVFLGGMKTGFEMGSVLRERQQEKDAGRSLEELRKQLADVESTTRALEAHGATLRERGIMGDKSPELANEMMQTAQSIHEARLDASQRKRDSVLHYIAANDGNKFAVKNGEQLYQQVDDEMAQHMQSLQLMHKIATDKRQSDLEERRLEEVEKQRVGIEELVAQGNLALGGRRLDIEDRLGTIELALRDKGINVTKAQGEAEVGLGHRKVDVEESLGRGELALGGRKVDVEERLGTIELALRDKGINVTKAQGEAEVGLGHRKVDVEESLGRGELALGGRKVDVEERLGGRELDVKERLGSEEIAVKREGVQVDRDRNAILGRQVDIEAQRAAREGGMKPEDIAKIYEDVDAYITPLWNDEDTRLAIRKELGFGPEISDNEAFEQFRSKSASARVVEMNQLLRQGGPEAIGKEIGRRNEERKKRQADSDPTMAERKRLEAIITDTENKEGQLSIFGSNWIENVKMREKLKEKRNQAGLKLRKLEQETKINDAKRALSGRIE